MTVGAEGAHTRHPAFWAKGCWSDVGTQFSPGASRLALNLPSLDVWERRTSLAFREGAAVAQSWDVCPPSRVLGHGILSLQPRWLQNGERRDKSEVVFVLPAPFWEAGTESRRHILPHRTSDIASIKTSPVSAFPAQKPSPALP